MILRTLIAIVLALPSSLLAQALGPFAPAAGNLGSTAISQDTSLIKAWANQCNITRGYQNIANTSAGLVTFGAAINATGMADGQVVSLGDAGEALYTFNPPLQNGSGADVAIFENGLSDTFLELAFVEISSNGVDFYRFAATSLTDTLNQIGAFGPLEASNLHNLAGKYRAGFGVPFDFEELANQPNLDISAVSHLKIIDVVGAINPSLANYDQNGRAINDPYPTAFASGGFDLDALAILNPNTIGVQSVKDPLQAVYPNPCHNSLRSSLAIEKATLYNAVGQRKPLVKNTDDYSLDLSAVEPGLYWLQLDYKNGQRSLQKIVRRL